VASYLTSSNNLLIGKSGPGTGFLTSSAPVYPQIFPLTSFFLFPMISGGGWSTWRRSKRIWPAAAGRSVMEIMPGHWIEKSVT